MSQVSGKSRLAFLIPFLFCTIKNQIAFPFAEETLNLEQDQILDQNEILEQNIKETINRISFTIQCIQNISIHSLSQNVLQTQKNAGNEISIENTEFHQFWLFLDVKIENFKKLFQSFMTNFMMAKANVQIQGEEEGNNGRNATKTLNNLAILIYQLNDIEKLCQGQQIESSTEKTAEELLLDFKFLLPLPNQLNINSFLVKINSRLQTILETRLIPGVIPQGKLLEIECGPGSLKPPLEIEYLPPNEAPGPETKSTSCLPPIDAGSIVGRLKRSTKDNRSCKMTAKRSNDDQDSSSPTTIDFVPTDTELAQHYKRSIGDIELCKLDSSCNCFHCYALNLPEETADEDSEFSDIDTFAVAFDTTPLPVHRKKSNKNANRSHRRRIEIAEKGDGEDDPEDIRRKIEEEKNLETIRNFEKVLSGCNRKGSSILEDMIVSVYHALIYLWKSINKSYKSIRLGKIQPYYNNSENEQNSRNVSINYKPKIKSNHKNNYYQGIDNIKKLNYNNNVKHTRNRHVKINLSPYKKED